MLTFLSAPKCTVCSRHCMLHSLSKVKVFLSLAHQSMRSGVKLFTHHLCATHSTSQEPHILVTLHWTSLLILALLLVHVLLQSTSYVDQS